MAIFPYVKPSGRVYNPGDYPQRRYRTLSGAVWKRSFGNTRVGMTLSLEFQNIKDEVAARILNHYEGQAGTLERFPISEDYIYAGMGVELRPAARIPSNALWAYASPPEVRSVHRGISTVSVELVGEVKYA